VLVDEIFIPHRSGTIRVPIDQRVTVFSGLDADARRRMTDLLVGALAGAGPASVRVRDALGRPAVISSSGSRQADGTSIEGPVPTLAPSAEELARCMVVRAADLGLGDERPDPAAVADRLATESALNELVSELAVATSGAAQRARLVAELEEIARIPLVAGAGGGPAGDTGVESDEVRLPPGRGPVDVAALRRLAAEVDRLILRRQAADDLLLHSATALRAMTAEGSAEHHVSGASGDDLGTGLLAAVEASRRAEQRRAALAATDPADRDPELEAEVAAACDEARTVLRQASARLESRRSDARAELDECDDALLAIALEAGVAVGPDGPAEALTNALRGGTLDPVREKVGASRASSPAEAAARTRALVERRVRLLSERVAELPTDEDVATARHRVGVAEARLAKLDKKLGVAPPEVLSRVRNTLLARATALRPDGLDCAVPLVLDDPLVQLDPTSHHDLLDVLARVAQRTQVVLLTEDRVVTTWARHRATRGEVRLVDLDGQAP
jgi:hypothetical protein